MPRKIDENEPEGFADFWGEWMPKKRKNCTRANALKRYEIALQDGATPTEIFEGARFYLSNLTPDELAFIPMATTWLDRKTFFDALEQKEAYEQRLLVAQQRREHQANVTHFQPRRETAFEKKWRQQKAADA